MLNRSLYENLCIISSTTPSSDRGIEVNPEVFYSTLEDRLMIAKRLNAELRSQCEEFKIEFLDFYDDYADEHGILCPELCTNNSFHIHSDHSAAIEKKLNQILSKYYK